MSIILIRHKRDQIDKLIGVTVGNNVSISNVTSQGPSFDNFFKNFSVRPNVYSVSLTIVSSATDKVTVQLSPPLQFLTYQY